MNPEYTSILSAVVPTSQFFGKAEVRIPLGKSRRRLEGDIEWILKK